MYYQLFEHQVARQNVRTSFESVYRPQTIPSKVMQTMLFSIAKLKHRSNTVRIVIHAAAIFKSFL